MTVRVKRSLLESVGPKESVLKPREADPLQLIRAPDLARLLSVHTITIWRWAREDPQFPKPVRVGRNVSCWRRREVEAWIARQQEHPREAHNVHARRMRKADQQQS